MEFLKKTRSLWIGLIAIALLGLLMPRMGDVTYTSKKQNEAMTWPQFTVTKTDGDEPTWRVIAKDVVPWTHVLLENGTDQIVPLEHGGQDRTGAWVWEWILPEGSAPFHLQFFHSCEKGCQTWGDAWVSAADPFTITEKTTPTKLGVVLADPERNWHGKQGWSVEIAYADSLEEDYWSVDDLALRVRQLDANGVRVLLRVEFAQGQTLPAPSDYAGLETYLAYIEQLARDVRFDGVYGFIIGSNINAAWANTLATDGNVITPEWYARVFNGYGEGVERTDNVIESVRMVDPTLRLFVAPVSPWRDDQSGAVTNEIDVPWLNYMNSMVSYLDAAAEANRVVGVSDSAPDGFAVQAFGRVQASQVAFDRAAEPYISLPRTEWNGAQSGFRVYEDWMAIINRYEHTKGKPIVINATNTLDISNEESRPIDNYPKGWLTNALDVVNGEPQIIAMCWFIDTFTHDERWNDYSLGAQKGLLRDGALEFEELLER